MTGDRFRLDGRGAANTVPRSVEKMPFLSLENFTTPLLLSSLNAKHHAAHTEALGLACIDLAFLPPSRFPGLADSKGSRADPPSSEKEERRGGGYPPQVPSQPLGTPRPQR